MQCPVTGSRCIHSLSARALVACADYDPDMQECSRVLAARAQHNMASSLGLLASAVLHLVGGTPYIEVHADAQVGIAESLAQMVEDREPKSAQVGIDWGSFPAGHGAFVSAITEREVQDIRTDYCVVEEAATDAQA